jgi:hypothetical protein
MFHLRAHFVAAVHSARICVYGRFSIKTFEKSAPGIQRDFTASISGDVANRVRE